MSHALVLAQQAEKNSADGPADDARTSFPGSPTEASLTDGPVADKSPFAAADTSLADKSPAVDATTDVDASMAANDTAPPDPTRAIPSGLDDQPGAAAQVAAWVVATRDNGALPFAIIDKVAADILVFDADGRLLGVAPVLVGLARGDDSAAGVGDRKLSAIKPDERTTPAGRFVAKFGAAAGDRTVLWVDYADSISLHPVVTTNPKEHRLQRIHSLAPEDHRISYGCINVPEAFYQDVVLKAFADGGGVVYVLPETKPLDEVFPGVGTASSVAQAEAPRIDAEERGLAPALAPEEQAAADMAADIESGLAAAPAIAISEDEGTSPDARTR